MYKELIGETLVEARKRLGKTVKEVEFDTKIRAKYIEALEADDFTKLPSDIYTQGFLKTYAQYLGLDPEPLLQQYKGMYATPNYDDLATLSSNMRVETKKKPVWLIAVIAAGSVAAVFVLLLIWGAVAQNMAKEPKVRIETINPRKTIDTVVAGATTSTTEKRAPKKIVSTTTTTTKPLNTVEADSGDEVAVKLTGIEDQGSWVKVTVDGEKKYIGVIEDGVSKLFEGESITVRIGNVTGLEVMLNGKKVTTKKFKSVNGIIEATFKTGS